MRAGERRREGERDVKCDECVVCMNAERTHAFVPCGHRCVCKKCGVDERSFDTCPLCREQIASVMLVHL